MPQTRFRNSCQCIFSILFGLGLLVFFFLCACSKDDAPENVFLTTQWEVDAFNHKTVNGDLVISGDFITDLSSLNRLKFIAGSLVIRRNYFLSSLEGLGNLKEVGKDIMVTNNPDIQSFDGFVNLERIGRDILISDNNSLVSLAGLNRLTSFKGNLLISHNESFSDFAGFKGEHLQSLTVHSNASLTNFSSLGEVKKITSFSVHNNNGLTSFEGFNNLKSIDGALYVSGNRALISFSGLTSLQTINQLTVVGNENLESLDGLSGLVSITGRVVIGGYDNAANQGNPKLRDFCPIRTALLQKNNSLDIIIFNNAYNPTFTDFVEGRCYNEYFFFNSNRN